MIYWLVVEPTHLNKLVKMGSSSPNRDENSQTFELPPPSLLSDVHTTENQPPNLPGAMVPPNSLALART